LICASATALDQRSDLIDLQPRIFQLQANVERAEDIRSIKRLQYSYGHYAEYGLWNDLADLFADKGIGHYPVGDLGKEGIRRLFVQDAGKGKFGLPEGMFYPHIMLQPVVTLDPDGKSAKGRWRVLAMLGSFGGSAIWAGGVYENEYILENGVWKIYDLHYYQQYSGKYEQTGWNVEKGAIPIHYDPARAGTPVPVAKSLPALAGTMTSIKSLNASLGDLRRRAQRLNNENEVENLQHIYGFYVGREHIRQSLKIRYPGGGGRSTGYFTGHQLTQPVIHVSPDGQSANIRVRLFQLGGASGANGMWIGGIYENKSVVEDGVWKLQAMDLDYVWTADYKGGWAHSAGTFKPPVDQMSSKFPPDRPLRGVVTAPFPKIVDVPFHYLNPVSGRKPPLYLP
jgi:hypothetical protein